MSPRGGFPDYDRNNPPAAPAPELTLGAGSAEGLLEQIAEELFQQSSGTRAGLTQRFEDALAGTGGYPAHLGPARASIEGQFSDARDRLIGASPGGGHLADTLGRLESSRAGANASLVNEDTQNALQQAIDVAFGSVPSATIAGLGSAATSQSNREGFAAMTESARIAAAAQAQAAELQADAAKGQAKGQLAGKIGMTAFLA